VTTPAERSARAALDAARPAVERLDPGRGAEDLAADLIDTWSAAEAALRALVGSTVLAGQPLIREARSRQLISFDQANALAELQAVYERVQNTAYRPTESDVAAARGAFLKLDAALAGQGAADAPRPTSNQAPVQAAGPAFAAVPVGAPTEPVVATPLSWWRRLPLWATVLAAVVIVALIGAGGYYSFGNHGGGALGQGVAAYQQGQRETAVNAFNRAVRDDPRDPLPHIYLARMAREVGNFPMASQELQLALQDDPSSELALREMGANLLAQNNYELARRFYVRALQADANDKMAEGYLGCALAKLGRGDEANRWFGRAGSGPWTNCASAAPASASAGTPQQPPAIPH
jgi:tetratricopeptide (TPR) repeat protein